MRAQSSRSTTRDFEATASTFQALQDAQIPKRLVRVQDSDGDSVPEGEQDSPHAQNTIQEMLNAILRRISDLERERSVRPTEAILPERGEPSRAPSITPSMP